MEEYGSIGLGPVISSSSASAAAESPFIMPACFYIRNIYISDKY
jgi:hypothetical protein